MDSAKYKDYRARLRRSWDRADVHPPVAKILADTWGYHPPVHDGVDVICPPNAVLFAMCKAKVIDVRSGGWWGKAPSGDVTKGDGIIQLEVLENIGPFKKGHHIGYGHAEKATVKVGQTVNAGDVIGHAGLAVAWHVHLMYNDGSTKKGIGNIDPRPILDYSVGHE
jgi:murein DD-endopeptidase MepM/ murein hydrolase activator NlpD